MKIPTLDLSLQHQPLETELLSAIAKVVGSNHFIMGPEVEQLEEEIAAYCGTPHAVGVSSGTDALLVALMALGIGLDDLVMTTTFSFFATAGVVARLGARPVFIDIDPVTYNMAPSSLIETWRQLGEVDRTRVRAIVPVHLFGQCADMTPILQFAQEHNIAVIEDAAQAIGAEYQMPDGGMRKAGSIGVMGCFSFFPSKNLGGFGDGGMIVTSDDSLAERLRVLRVHGAQPKYHHALVGGNFRLDALQAAILRVKLPHLDEWHRQRQEAAAYYDSILTKNGLDAILGLPTSVYANQNLCFPHIYNQYVVRIAERNQCQIHLASRGVATAVYYPIPLHRQGCFAYLGYEEGDLPVAEQAARQVLALPLYPGISREQQNYVEACLETF